MSERLEYYWIGNRLIDFTNSRNGNVGRFPKSKFSKIDLVAEIHRTPGGLVVKRGKAATPDRVELAILWFTRLVCDSSIADIGPKVPAALMKKVITQVSQMSRKVTTQWNSTGTEEGQSGLLAGLNNELHRYGSGGWSLRVEMQVFSPMIKEPSVGADIGVILDLQKGSQRVVKGVLIQAKKTANTPGDPLDLQDMRD